MTDGPTKLNNTFEAWLGSSEAGKALLDAVQGRPDATVNAPKPTGHAAVASEIERALAAFRAPGR